jgi:hypothetical protein
MTKRHQDRKQAVLPVTISGIDGDGSPFQDVVYTLDMTAKGLRLGGIHRQLRTQDRVVVQYRHRRVEFRVVWVNR